MNLYYDLRLRRFVTTPGLDDALDSLEFKAGDTEEIVLQFGRSPDASAPSSVITSPTWTAESLSAGATITIGIKASGDYHDGDFLAGTSSFTEDTGAKTYTFDLNLNTTEINTALNRDDADGTNDTAAIEDALFEMTFKSSPTAGVRSSIDDVTVTIKHDVISGGEGTPASAAMPSDYALTADTIQFLPAVSSQTGGTAADFDSVETVNRSAGEAFAFFDDDAGSVFRVYELVAGTDAESAPDTIRPDDYAASTNEKVFKLRLTIPTGTPLQADGSVAGTARQELALLNLTDATELTIATGAVTATQGFHTIDTESDAASDDLDTISGGQNGDLLVIGANNAARSVVVKHGTGNIQTWDASDITLDETRKQLLLSNDGTNWNVLSVISNVATALQADGSVAGTARQELSLLNLTDATELTISAGAVTATQGFHTIDTESDAASDDLDTISGGQEGDIIYFAANNAARTVVVKHGTGNIRTWDASDISLDEARKVIHAVHTGTNWDVLSVISGGGVGGTLTSDLDTNGNSIFYSKGADIASASALTPGFDGNYFDVTGTTTITSIATSGVVGTTIRLHFDDALTITHHATDLILPFAGNNIDTAAGDEATFVEYAAGDWRCTNYTRANGTALDTRIRDFTNAALVTTGTTALITSQPDHAPGLFKVHINEEVGLVGMPIAQFTSPGDGDVVTYNATTQDFELLTPSSSGASVAIIADKKAANTDGGTFTSGAWRTRDLNTEIADPDGIVSIASNEFTLAAGDYAISWTAPAVGVDQHVTRLYNVTSAAEVDRGTSMFATSSYFLCNSSAGYSRVTLASSAAFRIEHRCATTKATDGFGAKNNFGTAEVYTQVKIQKL